MLAGEPLRRRFAIDVRAGAPPAQVFPLLCPVREHDWIEGWSAQIVFSRSGVAEAGCVFRTGSVTCVVHDYVPPQRIGFTLFEAERWVELLVIDLLPIDEGTRMTWVREATALSVEGATALDARFLAYPDRHRWLERALAHYLATGRRIPRPAEG
jgi:uncharacterized protein YndB with AHSA1/START domain